jgi:hypothetical protein
MPVVINEFEVVTGADDARGQAAAPTPAEAQPRQGIDIERVLDEQRARARRVRAY